MKEKIGKYDCVARRDRDVHNSALMLPAERLDYVVRYAAIKPDALLKLFVGDQAKFVAARNDTQTSIINIRRKLFGF